MTQSVNVSGPQGPSGSTSKDLTGAQKSSRSRKSILETGSNAKRQDQGAASIKNYKKILPSQDQLARLKKHAEEADYTYKMMV